ncbi:hypothetical protein ABPG74_013638 [Tetrahymena malaccensis]
MADTTLEKEILKVEQSNVNLQDINDANKKSLQESFQKFRKERYEKMKHAKYLKAQKQDERRTTEFKEALRQKFIDQCKKYFGVPYHRKYWSEGESHHNAPLYLDCCGLIRQVVYDLREDFGFTLGRWNQAYQFDVCPKEVKFEEMKPGDLIFYSATYYNEKLKPFPHKMVHVEVFTGGETGEQTIGARWQKGFVQYHDSYKFVSKNYYDIQFYYRSLDPWLDGICQSCCKEHPWRDDRDLWVPDKFSVFSDPTLEENEDADQKEEIVQDENFEDKENRQVQQATNQLAKFSLKQNPKIKKDESKYVFVGKGNNDNLIRKYFQNIPGYTLLDASKAFSNKYFFKWVQTTSEIDFFSFKEATQIVNHIPNINIFTSKVGLVNLLKSYEEHKKASELEISSKDFFPESYQLDMMSDEIAFLTQETDPNSIWILKPHNNNMGRGIVMIGDIVTFKREFVETKKYKLGEYTTAYLIKKDTPIEDNQIEQLQKNNIQNDSKDQQNSSLAQLNQEAEKIQEQPKFKYDGISHHSIIQKYIKEPLLLNKRKFDIRCYGLIASTKPLLLLFNKGYARVCLQDYSLDDVESKNNKYCHLTNNAIQKSHKDFKAHKEDSIWTIEKLSEHIENVYQYGQEKQNEMWNQIKKIVRHVVLAGYPKLEKKVGQYELLGVDILIDQNLKPYLLEVNTNPALFVDTTSQEKVIPQMMHKALDIVLAVNDGFENISQNIEELTKKQEIHPFEIIYQKSQV